jgi:hypothetical protein
MVAYLPLKPKKNLSTKKLFVLTFLFNLIHRDQRQITKWNWRDYRVLNYSKSRILNSNTHLKVI